MDESIKFFVGLDTHKDSIAVAVCEAGREPSRFVGIMGPNVPGVLKMLRKYGPAQQVSVVYEAGPTGFVDQVIGSAPHVLVSAPSHLPTRRPAFGGLGSGLTPTGAFPEFTRFFHGRSHGRVTLSNESSALTN